MTADIETLIPRKPVPELHVPLVGEGTYDITAEAPDLLSLIVFYRGLHCPQCRLQLTDLEAKLSEFESRGVSVVAISADTRERAEEARSAWELARVRIGHSPPLSVARKWGLFVSSGRGKTSAGHEEPNRFVEPGLFLIRPDGTLYASSVQSMPFARPNFEDLLKAIDFIATSDYPARGEVERI